MATYFGAQATKILNTTPAKLAEMGFTKGKLLVISDSFDIAVQGAATSLLTGDVIKMGSKIPEGARVLDVRFLFPDLDSGSSITMDAGWLASDDASEAVNATGFASAITTAQAGGSWSMFTTAPTNTAFQKVFLAEVQPTITCHLQGSSVTTGKIYMDIILVVD